MSYQLTLEAKKRFKIWLIKNDMTIEEFATSCGCKRQYITGVLNGKVNVTPHVIDVFKRGGYDLI